MYKSYQGSLGLFLCIILYLLLFWLRYIQGGWDIEVDLFVRERQILDQKVSLFLPSPQAELLSGILLGNKGDLPAELKLALRNTSTLHIVVVSGQNLSMVAGFILALSGLIKRKIAITLAFLAVIFYTLMTGLQVPVLRAAIMVMLSFLAQIFGRQKDGLRVLVLTAALMLLVNPGWISDLSFQLSFLATLGVVWVAPILLKLLKSLPLIGQDLAVTLGAQLMVGPIIAQNFHQLSFTGVFANVMVGWTIPFIMILGSILLVASLLSQFLAQILALAISVFLTYFIYVVEFFSSLPFAWQYVGEQFWIVWVGYYMIVAGIMLSLSLWSNNKLSKI